MNTLMLYAIDLYCRQTHLCPHSASVGSYVIINLFGGDLVKTCPDTQIKTDKSFAYFTPAVSIWRKVSRGLDKPG